MKTNIDHILPLIPGYIERGLISEQTHPEDPTLKIYNYTHECQYSRAWDEVTRNCRGLIVHGGEIVARPFPKFFNYQEHLAHNLNIPNEHPTVYEKLDGSLGILYYLNGAEWIATRGSFVSEQAQWATRWWRENVPSDPLGGRGAGTSLFEIIFPENRVVVNYNFSGLVHLATIDLETGRSLNEDWGPPVQSAKKIPVTNYEELAKLDEPNSEGFVVFFPEENVRMKIKFPEYVRLHKVMTGLSEIGIWEHLAAGKSVLKDAGDIPDELYGWIESVEKRLVGEFDTIKNNVAAEFGGKMMDLYADNPAPTRKDLAEVIKTMTHPGLGFAALDKRNMDAAVWKMVRPHGKRVFKVDIDS